MNSFDVFVIKGFTVYLSEYEWMGFISISVYWSKFKVIFVKSASYGIWESVIHLLQFSIYL